MIPDRQRRAGALAAELDCGAALFVSYENRRYLTGFTGSAGWVLVTADGSTTLLTDGRYTTQAGEQVGDSATVATVPRLADALIELVGNKKVERIAAEAGSLDASTWLLMTKKLDAEGITLVNGAEAMQTLRACKDTEELQAIRQACQVAEDAAVEAFATCRAGQSERQLRRAIESAIYARGSDAVPFDFIVASGARSALPHGVASGAALDAAAMATLDWGAEWAGYFSDQTISFCFDQYAGELDEIYGVVRDAQEASLDAVRAGAVASDVDAAGRTVIERAGYGAHFTHSTGHGVGLAIHEYPSIAATSSVELLPGMVITIEPGIYLPYKGGVRLEDTIVVTDGGYERLTTWDKTRPYLIGESV